MMRRRSRRWHRPARRTDEPEYAVPPKGGGWRRMGRSHRNRREIAWDHPSFPPFPVTPPGSHEHRRRQPQVANPSGSQRVPRKKKGPRRKGRLRRRRRQLRLGPMHACQRQRRSRCCRTCCWRRTARSCGTRATPASYTVPGLGRDWSAVPMLRLVRRAPATLRRSLCSSQSQSLLERLSKRPLEPRLSAPY